MANEYDELREENEELKSGLQKLGTLVDELLKMKDTPDLQRRMLAAVYTSLPPAARRQMLIGAGR